MARRPLAFRVAMWRSGLRTSTSAVSCRSPADTSPGPRLSQRRVTPSSAYTRNTTSFRFKMMSVTSSLTPGRVVNSCRASSNRTWVTAAPGIEDSSVRRIELPRVWPNPGSRGLTANRWRLPSSSPMASTVGRWMMSMRLAPGCRWGLSVWGSEWGLRCLLGVQLDDERFAHGLVDVLALGQRGDPYLGAVLARFQPQGQGAVEGVQVAAHEVELP